MVEKQVLNLPLATQNRKTSLLRRNTPALPAEPPGCAAFKTCRAPANFKLDR